MKFFNNYIKRCLIGSAVGCVIGSVIGGFLCRNNIRLHLINFMLGYSLSASLVFFSCTWFRLKGLLDNNGDWIIKYKEERSYEKESN